MKSEDKKDHKKQRVEKDGNEQGLGQWIMSNLGRSPDQISGNELNKKLNALADKDTTNPDKQSTKGKKSGGLGNWIKTSFTVPKEISTARLNICKSCEKYRPTTKTCKVCNCFMPGKVHINNVSCPEGKWGRALKI